MLRVRPIYVYIRSRREHTLQSRPECFVLGGVCASDPLKSEIIIRSYTGRARILRSLALCVLDMCVHK